MNYLCFSMNYLCYTIHLHENVLCYRISHLINGSINNVIIQYCGTSTNGWDNWGGQITHLLANRSEKWCAVLDFHVLVAEAVQNW